MLLLLYQANRKKKVFYDIVLIGNFVSILLQGKLILILALMMGLPAAYVFAWLMGEPHSRDMTRM